MEGIDAYKEKHQNEDYRWPVLQNSHIDLIISGKTCQFKTGCASDKYAGLKANLTTSAGTDEEGKILTKPYPANAFQFLIVAHCSDEGRYHFWRIPSPELEERGYFSTPTELGKTGLIVYAPPEKGIGKQPDPEARKQADTWTEKYYTS